MKKEYLVRELLRMSKKDIIKLCRFLGVSVTKQTGGYFKKESMIKTLVGGGEDIDSRIAELNRRHGVNKQIPLHGVKPIQQRRSLLTGQHGMEHVTHPRSCVCTISPKMLSVGNTAYQPASNIPKNWEANVASIEYYGPQGVGQVPGERIVDRNCPEKLKESCDAIINQYVSTQAHVPPLNRLKIPDKETILDNWNQPLPQPLPQPPPQPPQQRPHAASITAGVQGKEMEHSTRRPDKLLWSDEEENAWSQARARKSLNHAEVQRNLKRINRSLHKHIPRLFSSAGPKTKKEQIAWIEEIELKNEGLSPEKVKELHEQLQYLKELRSLHKTGSAIYPYLDKVFGTSETQGALDELHRANLHD